VARLGDRIGRLAPALMAQVGESLSFVLDLEEQ
jgi:mRNA-degrading endonuclease toxin of MazEF toxin-antitoxin module